MSLPAAAQNASPSVRAHLAQEGPVFFTHDALNSAAVRHGFFTRKGGVSTGLYDSLNCGLGSDDQMSCALQNRARVAAALDLQPAQMAGLYQIHSPKCVVLSDPAQTADRPQADAYATALTKVGLAILTADCLPVLFCEPAAGVIGAAHAGWRGAAGGVIEATIEAMCGLGARLDKLVMVIGPGIHQPSYQVSTEMRDEIIAGQRQAEACFTPDPAAADKCLFDLPAYAVQRGKAAGLKQIYTCGLDTYQHEELFFSHRRATHNGEPDSGRLISVITQN